MSRRAAALGLSLAALLVVGFVISLSTGQLGASFTQSLGSSADLLGWHNAWTPRTGLTNAALQQIRFPRAVMAIVIGAGLAVAGAVMQAIFGNPLAEPGVVGVSSGAAFGAALAITTGATFGGEWAVTLAAFVGGILATLFVYGMSRSQGRTDVVTLLLTGIAVNAFAGAGIALVMFIGTTGTREQIVFFQLGSLNGSRWSEVGIVTVVVAPALLTATFLSRQYDLLSLGERTAFHLGVHVERLRTVSILLVALLTGAGVAFAGIIAFVGLVVPHLIRMVLGPGHRVLIPMSALGGAVLLTWADTCARTAVEGADLPIGVLTSLIGGPFFLYLIRQSRKRSGGWA